jgi:hypothetical protein
MSVIDKVAHERSIAAGHLKQALEVLSPSAKIDAVTQQCPDWSN